MRNAQERDTVEVDPSVDLDHLEAQAVAQDFYGKVRREIDGCGFFAVGVLADEANDVPFTYTVGLAERGWPELIIFAIPPVYAHAMFEAAIKEWKRTGTPNVSGDVSDELANLPTAFAALPDKAFDDFLCQARFFYKHEGKEPELKALQLVWPDPEGRFPWDPGCAEKYVRLQDKIVDVRVKPR